MDEKTINRFWSKVEKKEGDSCWEWIGCKDAHGYGEFPTKFRKKHTRGHQMSWIIHFGEIPDGLGVLHRCDNPSCVNPKHLFLGTQADNNRDMNEKGRRRSRFLYGENHPQHGTNSKFHKLTEDQVKEIRRLKLTGEYTLREIAEMFGVTHGVINNICQGRKWKWLK